MTIEASLILNQLQDPKSAQRTFHLPCGIVENKPDGPVVHREVVLDEMTGRAEKILGSTEEAFHRRLSSILTLCVRQIGDITDKRQLEQALRVLTEGDRLFLLVMLRRRSIGDFFPFRDDCPACRKISTHNYDLRQLRINPPEDPTKRLFDEELPSGSTCTHAVLMASDEERREAYSNALKGRLLEAFIRLRELDGKPPTTDDILDMPQRDLAYLRGRFVEVDGGLDTQIALKCKWCKHEYKTDLDVASPGFFSPSETLNVWKKRSDT